MPNGGKLTIETSNAFLDERYAPVRHVSPGGTIAVCDTAPAWAPRSQTFSTFFTTRARGRGRTKPVASLWLRQTIRRARDDLQRARRGYGQLYLPRFFSAARERPKPSPRGSAAAGEVILVVEDDNEVRAYVVEILRV